MENEELIKQMARALLTLEQGYDMMYKIMMENHKRLNYLEKEFVKLERGLKK